MGNSGKELLKLSEGHHLRGCMMRAFVRENGTSRGLFEVWESRSAEVTRFLRLSLS